MTIHFAVGPLEQFIEPRNYELRELVANPSPTRKPGWSRVAGDTPAGGDHAQYSLTLASTPLPAQQMPLPDEGGRLKRIPAQFHTAAQRSNASHPVKARAAYSEIASLRRAYDEFRIRPRATNR